MYGRLYGQNVIYRRLSKCLLRFEYIDAIVCLTDAKVSHDLAYWHLDRKTKQGIIIKLKHQQEMKKQVENKGKQQKKTFSKIKRHYNKISD